MDKVCSECEARIPAPMKPEHEAELCPDCGEGETSKPAEGGSCGKCEQGVPHEHKAM